ncbi:sulfatase [Streptomyces fructofermentans]|uniref:sulfatase n=1 Tax=Streptomyces fructofermentans TaxID=152141 RepID=UPI0033DE9D5D
MSHSTRSSQLPDTPRRTDPDTDSVSAADPDRVTGAAPESGPEPGTNADTGTETEPGAKPATGPESEPEPDTEADTSSEAGTDPDPGSADGPEQEAAGPAATPEPAQASSADSDSDSDSDSGSLTEASAQDEPKPEPGEKVPSAQAAPDDVPGPGTPEDGTAAARRSGGRVRTAWRTWRGAHPQASRALTVTTSVLAGVLVLFALLVPNQLDRLTVGAFFRIPAEGILITGLLLVMPPRPRRITAAVTGVVLGLLTVLKLIDMGFYSVLDRPFDLILDWILFSYAVEFLRESVGPTGTILAVVAVVVLVVALLVLMTLAVARLTRLLVSHRHVATRTTLILGTAWITCVTLGVQFADVPVASSMNAKLVQNRVDQVQAGIKDGRVFARQTATDTFADTPPDQLLTGLRGKDVLFTFIESYGRSAIEDPAMAKEVGTVLDNGSASLEKAGFSSRSGWLRSPIAGAGSWLAHSTFMSGLWVKNQQRYRTLTASDRMTLTSAFGRTKAWRTVGIVPGVRRAWPEGKFFGLDHIYDSEHLGYNGPYFSWTPVPDQFSLEAFERLEHGKKDRDPIMAEIILASSHNPWAPVARMTDWDDLGDGSVFHEIKKEGKDPKEVWKNPESVRTEYRHAIEYSLTSLVQYVERYGDEDTVLVFLGDHQPNPTVTGSNASRDVPVTIVAHDKKVLDKVSDWGWTDGLKPAEDAPRWRMDKFRDRFMTAYGPNPGSAAGTSAP